MVYDFAEHVDMCSNSVDKSLAQFFSPKSANSLSIPVCVIIALISSFPLVM